MPRPTLLKSHEQGRAHGGFRPTSRLLRQAVEPDGSDQRPAASTLGRGVVESSSSSPPSLRPRGDGHGVSSSSGEISVVVLHGGGALGFDAGGVPKEGGRAGNPVAVQDPLRLSRFIATGRGLRRGDSISRVPVYSGSGRSDRVLPKDRGSTAPPADCWYVPTSPVTWSRLIAKVSWRCGSSSLRCMTIRPSS